MEVFHTIADYKNLKLPVSIGFVPTMGALHTGHASLVQRSLNENETTIASIFVNPTQFNEKKDFDSYPNTLEQDLKLLKNLGVDLVYIPDVSDMYVLEPQIHVQHPMMNNVLEGKCRPGHFDGVALVVTKLLNRIKPDRAYFGKKDYQQLKIITDLSRDLDLGVEIVGCPTVRESSGLPLSSRNLLLEAGQRAELEVFYDGLKKGLDHELEINDLIYEINALLASTVDMYFEYLEILETTTFLPSERIDEGCRIFFAIKLPQLRIIDNFSVTKKL